MTVARALLAVFLAALALLGAGAASAHDSRPLSISILQQGPDLYRVAVRPPPTLELRNAPVIAWPGTCRVEQAGAPRADGTSVAMLSCPEGLEGGRIGIDYPVYNPSLTTLIRVEGADGPAISAVLAPDTLVWTVPAAPDRLSVARNYLVMGFQHIWEGPDHLMFVAGLMLLAGTARRTLLAVTGFTLAHSITLSLAVLDVVRVPIVFVEAMIALSIVFLAAELARGRTDSFSRRNPAALSFGFGLLHGFGFASALGEIGLPAGELAVGLVAFNLGVEAGQLFFVALAGALFLAWRMSPLSRSGAFARLVTARGATLGAYVLGGFASLWFFERALQAAA